MRARFLCVSMSLLVLASSSCASFTHRIASTARTEERTALAGATLACAGEASRTAIILTLVGTGVSAASSIAGGLAVGSTDPSFITFMGLASFGLGIGSLAAAVASLVFLWDSAAYTEQAGRVLAGHDSVGGCESQPPPRVHRAPPPRPKKARKAPKRPRTGTRDGHCYGNDTCNAGLTCVEGTCESPATGTLGGECYGNQTCNGGLTCAVDGRCVAEEGRAPLESAPAESPVNAPEPNAGDEERRVLPVD